MAKVFKKGLIATLSIVLFLVFYPIKLARYFYEKVFLGNSRTSIGMVAVFAETFCSVQEAVKILLPDAQSVKEETKILTDGQKQSISKAAEVVFDPTLDKEYHVYIAESNGRLIGYAMEDTVKGKWGNIHYMMGFSADGKITDVVVLELQERRGRPVKERKFLDQFVGKTTQEPIRLKKDIKGVGGATISSTGMTNGIRKMAFIFNELYKK